GPLKEVVEAFINFLLYLIRNVLFYDSKDFYFIALIYALIRKLFRRAIGRIFSYFLPSMEGLKN
ncbi:MAG: hypothetical protein QXO92_04620, partial [Candidatus Bathyarchaeia archaeon]